MSFISICVVVGSGCVYCVRFVAVVLFFKVVSKPWNVAARAVKTS